MITQNKQKKPTYIEWLTRINFYSTEILTEEIDSNKGKIQAENLAKLDETMELWKSKTPYSGVETKWWDSSQMMNKWWW